MYRIPIFESVYDREEIEEKWHSLCEKLSPLDDRNVRYIMRGTNPSKICLSVAEEFDMSPRYALNFKPTYRVFILSEVNYGEGEELKCLKFDRM